MPNTTLPYIQRNSRFGRFSAGRSTLVLFPAIATLLSDLEQALSRGVPTHDGDGDGAEAVARTKTRFVALLKLPLAGDKGLLEKIRSEPALEPITDILDKLKETAHLEELKSLLADNGSSIDPSVREVLRREA